MGALPFDLERKALLGMLHLDPLPGEPGSPGLEALLERALGDLRALEEGGASGVILENWRDQSPGPFLTGGQAAALGALARELSQATTLPLGVNVLPNDYRTALALAPCGVRFLWLDVFVDAVATDYSYSEVDPFEVRVDLADFQAWRERFAPDAALLASVHPKHYRLLNPEDTLAASVGRALAAGADAIVITGRATGQAPHPDDVALARQAGAECVLVGSGVDASNAPELLREAQGAIVGSSLKPDLSAPIEVLRVRQLRRTLDALG